VEASTHEETRRGPPFQSVVVPKKVRVRG